MKIAGLALTGSLLLSTVALAKETTETFKISGWHCEGCAGRTADAVKHLQGVKDATANPESKTLTVVYDDSVAKSSEVSHRPAYDSQLPHSSTGNSSPGALLAVAQRPFHSWTSHPRRIASCRKAVFGFTTTGFPTASKSGVSATESE